MLTPDPIDHQQKKPLSGLFQHSVLGHEWQKDGDHNKRLPKLTSHYYQRTSRRYIMAPFVLLLLVLLGIFSFFDLLKTVNDKISDTKFINRILAQSVAERQTNLLTSQIKYTQAARPDVKSIVFYPILGIENKLEQAYSTRTIFLDSDIGVSEPVYLTDSESNAPTLLGYIQTTLDLSLIRRQWVINNIPMFGIIAVLAASILTAAILMVKKVIHRLPFLEKLSQEVLALDMHNVSITHIDGLIDTANQYNQQAANQSKRWIFEKALVYLLSHVRAHHSQYVGLEKEITRLRQTELEQTIERSKIQNTLLLELKMALKRIQAGLQLLANHYISQEQQDAVDVIDQGADELNKKLDQIIQFQRMERGQIGIEQHHFDPDDLVQQLIEKYTSLADKKNLNLTYKNHHAHYALEGDTQKITTILASFIENALQYTEQGKIEIISRIYHLQDDLRWEVAVNDTGIGIDARHFEAIFDPFYQVNPDIYEEITLFRVDLSLVKKLAQMMGATIQVKSELGKGASFIVTFAVKDWTQHFDRIMLKDKQLALLSIHPAYQSLRKKFETSGASITDFADIQLLKNYLALHQIDALLLTPDYPIDKLTALVANIRASEQSHRMAVIYYYQENALLDFDELRTAGVDYFEAFYAEDNNQDYYVKNLYKVLS